jgi:hypothetical protein
MTTTTTRRAWVGCYACRNGGYLIGQWIDADELDYVTAAQVHGLAPNESIITDDGGRMTTDDEGRVFVTLASGSYAGHVEEHEEFACFDLEGFGRIFASYDPEPREVAQAALMLERADLRGVDLEIIEAWHDYSGEPLTDRDWEGDLEDKLDETYAGTWDSLADFAESYAADIGAFGATPHWPFDCIDWDRAANDLGVYSEPVSGGLAVFWPS